MQGRSGFGGACGGTVQEDEAVAALSLYSGATGSSGRCRRGRRSAYWSGDAVPQLEGVKRPS